MIKANKFESVILMKKYNSKLMAVDLAEIALFVALMCVFTLFVSIPFYPVPLTFQTVISVLAGLLLGWKKGAIAMAIYCVMGLIGIPVFANFGSGFVYFLKPSFGYIIGFIFSAFVAGIICQNKKYPLWRYIVAAVAAFLVNYLIGIPYFALIWRYVYNSADVWEACLTYNILYMPKDLILCVLAAIVAWRVVPAINKGRGKLATKQPAVPEKENVQE
jgi:biotin transport system substrate-specific component